MTLLIRRFEHDDADAVRAVFMRSWIELCDRLKLDRSKVNPDEWFIKATWVAVHEGVIVGFVSLEEETVDMLYVDPNSQRLGVGSSLLEKALADGATWLWVDEHSTEGRAFYEKNGWHWNGVVLPGYNFPEEPLFQYIYTGLL